MEYLEDQERKKIEGKIQRFFAISDVLEDPRIGLRNAQSIQNQLIRMACFNKKDDRLVLSSIACICENCVFGRFSKCEIYKHEIVQAEISKSRSSKSLKKARKNHEEYIEEENDFNENWNEWERWIDDKNVNNPEVKTSAGSQNLSKPDENRESNDNIENPTPIVIEDDPEYWTRRNDFNNHLKKLFQDFKKTEEYHEAIDSNGSYDKIQLSGLDEVFNCINEENGSDSDFELGEIENLTIHRSALQECSGNYWFSSTMINLAFKNIQFRSEKKIICFRDEFMQTIQVVFDKFLTIKIFLNFLDVHLNHFQSSNWEQAIEIHPEYSKFDLRNADYVIFPIHNNDHWLFGGINLGKHEIVVIDSMRLYGAKFLELFQKAEAEINSIFLHENEKNPKWNYLDISSGVPLQNDGTSCGPLTVLNAEIYTKNSKFEYNIEDIIRKLRKNICLSVFLQFQISEE